ncbi:MAG: four helix bundle protein [Verrucomicrobiota bacterium]
MVNVKGEESSGQPHGLKGFGAYQKALELFDLAVGDLAVLARKPETARLVSQHIASADSIAANIGEGYGRGSRKDYSHFLIIARGSAPETAGRYLRLPHWLPNVVVTDRARLCQEIIGILTATIRKLRLPE